MRTDYVNVVVVPSLLKGDIVPVPSTWTAPNKNTKIFLFSIGSFDLPQKSILLKTHTHTFPITVAALL